MLIIIIIIIIIIIPLNVIPPYLHLIERRVDTDKKSAFIVCSFYNSSRRLYRDAGLLSRKRKMDEQRIKTFRLPQLLLILLLLLVHCVLITGNQVIQQWKDENAQFEAELLLTHDHKYHLKISFGNEKCPENHPSLKPEDILYVSENEYSRDSILKYLGPDEILIEVGGKTYQSLLPHYLNCRMYYSSFIIEYTGVYHISIIHIHSNYTSVNERAWSYANYSPLVEEWVQLNGTDLVADKKDECPYESGGVWKVNPTNVDLQRGVFDKMEVAKTVPRQISHGAVEKNITLPFHINFQAPYNGKICIEDVNQYSWTSESCGFGTFSRDEASQILENKFIVFSGDSQMRTLAINFFHEICGIRLPFQYGRPPNFYIPRGHPYCKNTRIQFINDAYCTVNEIPQFITHTSGTDGHTLQHPRPKVDLFIANCGQHPATYSVEKYSDLVKNYRDQMIDFGFNSRNFLWMETVPLPLRQDPVVVGDPRTIQRMELFNIIADKIMAAKGMTIGHYFLPMLTFCNKLCDIAHYTMPNSNTPAIQRILRALKFHK